MRILTTMGASARHAALAVTEAALVAAIGGALVLGTAVVTGEKPAGADIALAGTTSSSWIALAQVDGKLASSIQPKLGDSVSFDTGYPKTVKNPRIEVLCYQSGSLVYGEAGGVADTFLLGGASSTWHATGGAAACTANLFYFGYHAGRQTYNVLATTSFSAGG